MITRASSCTGKIRHRDAHGAGKHLQALGNPRMRSYRCRFCQGWHIGHATPLERIQDRFDKLIGPDPNLPPL